MTLRRTAFTLVEMLVVIAALAFIGGVLIIMLKQTFDMQRLQASGFDRLLQTTRLADDFRGDVAKAEQAIRQWQDYEAGPNTLILTQNDNTRKIIYQWSEGKLRRFVYEADDVSERIVPFDSRSIGLEFVQPLGKTKLVRLRLHRLTDGREQPGQTLEFTAALGGDTR